MIVQSVDVAKPKNDKVAENAVVDKIGKASSFREKGFSSWMAEFYLFTHSVFTYYLMMDDY